MLMRVGRIGLFVLLFLFVAMPAFATEESAAGNAQKEASATETKTDSNNPSTNQESSADSKKDADAKATQQQQEQQAEPAKQESNSAAEQTNPEPIEPPAPADNVMPAPAQQNTQPAATTNEESLPEKPLDLTEKTPIVEEKEELKFVEWKGYYRVRMDLFHKLDVGAIDTLAPPCFSINKSTDKKCGNLFFGANMRLMLNPTINISEDVRIIARFDVLDNLVLGSTPDTLDFTLGSPNAYGYPAFSTAQLSPERGFNAFMDAIHVKALYGEVRIPVGLIRFGRMPSQFGMGMYVNSGAGIDDDYGDFVDRIMFITKLFDHYIFGSWDMPNEGITMHYAIVPVGQEKDLTNIDDLTQWTFGFARKDSAETVKEKRETGEIVLNYGMLNVIRMQDYEIPSTITGTQNSFGTPAELENVEVVQRDLFIYVMDLWTKFIWRDLQLEAEGVMVYGSLSNINPPDQNPEKCDILQYGLVVKGQYEFLDRMLLGGLEFGMASGDHDKGWGVYPILSEQDHYSGGKQYSSDREITNFRFDPDYHVDLILFREIVKTVTDAMYFKMVGEYRPAPGLGVRLEGIYSMTFNPTSAAFYKSDVSLDDAEKLATDKSLGFEIDAHVYYQTMDKFRVGLSYGIFFPGAALGQIYKDDNNNTLNWKAASGVAQTFQAMLAILF